MRTSSFDVIIIGAGAAGLMCAIEAGKRKRSVLLLDKVNKIAGKILISGGGRCNFTNLYTTPENYLSSNPHFCKSALSRYSQWDFIALMDQYQIPWHEKTLGQLFCDNKASSVVDMLVAECENNQVKIQSGCEITAVAHQDQYLVTTTQGEFKSNALVVATGGPSIPRMGATDFGLQVARQFRLRNIPFRPALVPFTFSQEMLTGLLKDLAGVALNVRAECNHQSFTEGLLFTHRGLSGPAMLQISSYWQKGDSVKIDLLPEVDAFTYLKQEKAQHPNKFLKSSLSELLPKKLAQRLSEQFFNNIPLGEMTDKMLSSIAQTLHQWIVTPSGTEGMRTAEVSSGGVDTAELSSKTFEAKNQPGLYFIGETVDVTGQLGGFNFQWAWASGWCAGQYV